MIQAIFFDFNGVIIDDERIQMAAYQEVLRRLYGIELTEQEYFAALGMDDRTFVRSVFERVDEELGEDKLQTVLAAKLEVHRKFIKDELPLCSGVVTFLTVASRHYALGVVSMADRNEVDYVLDRARLGPLFSVIVSADDVKVCKPAPDCYKRALDVLNDQRVGAGLAALLSQQCLAVEDSPPGILSARGAGMRTMGVTNTVSESELRAAGADVVTESLADWTVDSVRLVFSPEFCI